MCPCSPHASYAVHKSESSKAPSKPRNQATGLLYIISYLCTFYCRRLQSLFWNIPWRRRGSVRRPRQHMPHGRQQTKLLGQLPLRQKLPACSCGPAEPGDVCGHTHLCRNDICGCNSTRFSAMANIGADPRDHLAVKLDCFMSRVSTSINGTGAGAIRMPVDFRADFHAVENGASAVPAQKTHSINKLNASEKELN